MADILQKICAHTRLAVEQDKSNTPLGDMDMMARNTPPTKGFAAALTATCNNGGYGLIAEIKKASPSAGLIRSDFNPAQLAIAYKQGGASCLSVLTDTPYFQGHKKYLQQARKAVDLPILRKDFIIDEYQIFQSRVWGADCILLIVACLDDVQLSSYESIACDLGMDVLVEVHDESELNRALQHTKSPLIGVNNRDLKRMVTDISTTERLAGMVGKDRTVVSESGLKTKQDLDRMAQVGAVRFLVGEHLMRFKDVKNATKTLLFG